MSITELEFKITKLILGKDMAHVRAFLLKNYRVTQFGKLSPDQLKHFLDNYHEKDPNNEPPRPFRDCR